MTEIQLTAAPSSAAYAVFGDRFPAIALLWRSGEIGEIGDREIGDRDKTR